MTEDDGRNDDEDDGHGTMFVLVLAIALIVAALICALGAPH